MDETEGFILPKNVRPLRYCITIEPDLENFTFRGTEIIEIEILEPTSHIALNAADLEIGKVSVWQGDDAQETADSAFIKDLDKDMNKEKETVVIHLTDPLISGKARMRLAFHGTLNDKLVGFYRARYSMPDGTERYMATTQFEAVDARRAFPCFDEPASKAKFNLTIIAPKGKTVLSNMPISEEIEDAHSKIVIFEQTPLMSTYLLAFTISDLEHIGGHTKNDTLVRVFTTPGKKEQGRFAFEVGIRALEYFEEYFGISYPLPKLDILAIPDFAAGAMENWGLVTFRENAVLIDQEKSSIAARQRVAGVITHELAHQWFGNLVTMAWWNDLWLNEGFASWIGDKALDHLFPQWHIWNDFYTHVTSSALTLDGLESTHPIEVEVKDPKEVNQIFDAITYLKGASLIRMLENYLTEDVFRQGLRVYLNRHTYGNARTEDLWQALLEVSGQPIGDMMDTWTKQPGFPIIEAKTFLDASKKNCGVLVSQKPFIQLTDQKPSQEQRLWQVPIEISSSENTRDRKPLDTHKGRVFLQASRDVSWVKLNASQTGFFRVQYSPEMLEALYPAIENKELSVLDRTGLADDVYALQKARMIPATQFLELAQHYRKETDYAVWSNLASGVAGVANRLASQPYHRELEHFAKSLLNRIYMNVRWDGPAEEEDMRMLLRRLILSHMGSYGHRGVIREAKRRFVAFLADPSSLTPNLRDVVCNITAKYGDETIYENLLDLYGKTSLQEEKSRYTQALGRFRDTALLKRTLEFAMSREVRSQDTIDVIASVARNRIGKDLAWQFVKANWQEFQERYGGGISFMISRLIEATTAHFCTPEKRREVEEFFVAHPVPAASRALAQSLENIDINIAWLDINRDAVGKWLESRNRS